MESGEKDIVYGHFKKWKNGFAKGRFGEVGETYIRLLFLEQFIFGRFAQYVLWAAGYRFPENDDPKFDDKTEDVFTVIPASINSQKAMDFIAHGYPYISAAVLPEECDVINTQKSTTERLRIVLFHRYTTIEDTKERLDVIIRNFGEEKEVSEEYLQYIKNPEFLKKVHEAVKESNAWLKSKCICLVDEGITDEVREELSKWISEKEGEEIVWVLNPDEYIHFILQDEKKIKVLLDTWKKLRNNTLMRSKGRLPFWKMSKTEIVELGEKNLDWLFGESQTIIPEVADNITYEEKERKIIAAENKLQKAYQYFKEKKYEECGTVTRNAIQALLGNFLIEAEYNPDEGFHDFLEKNKKEIKKLFGKIAFKEFQLFRQNANPLVHNPDEFMATVVLMLERASWIIKLFKLRTDGLFNENEK